ncbi:MAG: outer membrane lipoprotein-sorting protein [Bacteroidetes bacterium]|nr:outer membrane lipoprotein-sorting protein [Bacteroidota bacterium]
MKKIIAALLFLIPFPANPASAKKPVMISEADSLLSKAVEAFGDVSDFTVTIDAEVNMEQVQVPNMHATMYFKKPDKIHFDSKGFLFVPRDGIILNPAVLSDRYNASLVQSEMAQGRMVYKLQLAAKETKTKLRQMYVWLESVNWTILKIETIPYEGRTLTMDFSYELVQEKFWLPSKIVFTLGSTGEREKSSEILDSQQGNQFGNTRRSMPWNGSVTIAYSDYKVNTGIDDSLFEKK